MHDRRGVGHIEERIGLFLGKNLMDAVVDLLPLFDVEGAAAFHEQPVHLGVPVADEIVFTLFGLARMPDVVEVRVAAHAPAEDDGVEGPLVDLLQKGLPLHDPDVRVDAHGLQVLLDDLGGADALGVPLVGHDREPEGPAVLFEDAVAVPVCSIPLPQAGGAPGQDRNRSSSRSGYMPRIRGRRARCRACRCRGGCRR